MGYLIQRQIRQNLRAHWPKLGSGDTTELMVLYTLADHADEGRPDQGASVDAPGGTRMCHPSVETITSQGLVAKRQVQRAIASLRSKGYITVKPHPVHSTHQYTVTDMVAGNTLLAATLTNATATLANATGMSEEDAASRVRTMVGAWELTYASEHDGCAPTPQVTAAVVNDIVAALLAMTQTAPLQQPPRKSASQPGVPHLHIVPSTRTA